MKLILTNEITLFKLKAWLFVCLQRQRLHRTGFIPGLLPVVAFLELAVDFVFTFGVFTSINQHLHESQ